jgi:hypothetical protein
MQYLLLIYDQENRWTKLSEAQQKSETEEYGAFGQEFANAIRGGNALQPTPAAKTVRLRNGKPQVTDGPFAETKEQLGGYYLVEAAIPPRRSLSRPRFPGRATARLKSGRS